MLTKLTVILAFLLCLHPVVVSAQAASTYPEIPIDSKTLRVQEQADRVYERTDYERAFFIYRNELAPIGDKYAQYMVGYMYLAGKGVREDHVTASAWYRLAAERGTKEFIKARDRLVSRLDAGEMARSDQLFVQLRKDYGDLTVLMQALREDFKALQARTGSRLASDTSPVAVINLNRPSGSRSGSDYYGQIERRIQARLEYLAHKTQIEIIDIDVASLDLNRLEQQVSEYLQALN